MKMYQKILLSGAVVFPFVYGSAFAAEPVNLRHQKVSVIQSIVSASPMANTALSGIKLEETKRTVDFKQTLHVRFNETYLGYRVIGGDAILHIPNGANAQQSLTGALMAAKNTHASMNGIIYENLHADLANTPAVVFTSAQAQKALRLAIESYQQKMGLKSLVTDGKSQLVVYMDDDHKAHFAFAVSFSVEPAKEGMMPAKPNFIMDAINFTTYQSWDNIQTVKEKVRLNENGGGFGGNPKMGKRIYDGEKENFPVLEVTRDSETNTCYLKNDQVTVKNNRDKKVENFPCKETDSEHNGVYWDGEKDAVNGGYSPDNDALYGGAVIKHLYQDWYGIPVLTENGKPMMLNMIVHARMDNAYWDGSKMTFGDGINYFYPLTSLGVAAHEISHGFTQQHSDLAYYGQSGGMNESFSDMAAQAAEMYAYGNNSWQIGPEIFKAKNKALRYMDKPSKDCGEKRPGNWCSIDSYDQYFSGLDVHFSSGLYNRVFYLIGTADGWNVRKAFDVMLQANSNYWTTNTSFSEGACGVLKATKDLGYDEEAVTNAFEKIKVDISEC